MTCSDRDIDLHGSLAHKQFNLPERLRLSVTLGVHIGSEGSTCPLGEFNPV